MELQEKYEAYVQQSLSGVKGYTLVWQSIGPSLETLAFLSLVHSEEASGISIQGLASEAMELGLSSSEVHESIAHLRGDNLLKGSDTDPVVGPSVRLLMEGLNEAYPTMQGIVLPAYLIQLLHELLQGRNDLNKAYEQVDQALSSSDSEDKITQEDPAEVAARRDGFLKRLASIRKSLVEKSSRELNVQEVAPAVSKASFKTLVVGTRPEVPAPSVSSAQADRPLAASEHPAPQPASDPEKTQREAFLSLQREKMELERQREELIIEKRELEEARLSTAEASGEIEESAARANLTRGDSEDDIAAAIARFEESLSLVCPVCGTGTLEERATDNGKIFYRCDDRSCGFVTWKKPYPFACPVCKNSFLVENDEGDGLTCPKSVCSFKQMGMEAPAEKPSMAPSPGTRKVRKVRRVVRRKKS